MTDVIDSLAGLTPDSPVAKIRDRKPITREQAQASHRALFEPADTADMSLLERFAVATFVAELHGQRAPADFYAAGMARAGATPAFLTALNAEITDARGAGPYGIYPKGPLSDEDIPGPTFSVRGRSALGDRLAAALGHVHMLVLHPRDAAPDALKKLLDAGWSTTGIVTLSQLVAFLAFQIRAAAGLRILDAMADDGADAATGDAP